MNIGFLGLGEHAIRGHIQHLLKNQNINIIYGFDPSPEKQAFFLNLSTKCKVAENEDNLLNSDISAVFICSPDSYHISQLEKAINKNLHVFCEKPIANNKSEYKILKKILKTANEKKIIISTCHPRRLDPPCLKIKELIDNGWVKETIGKINNVDFNFWYYKISDHPNDQWKKNRSLLLDHFSHEIDLISFLLSDSEKESIKAKLIQDTYNSYEVHGQLNNVNFRFNGKRFLNDISYNEFLQLSGDKGSIVFNLTSSGCFILPTIEHFNIPAVNYDIRFNNINDNFINSIINNESLYIKKYEILRNTKLAIDLKENKKTYYKKSFLSLKCFRNA